VSSDTPLLPDWRGDADSVAPFARLRLAALDLDGTLLSASQPDRVLDKIGNLRLSLRLSRPATRLTIATGRALAGARKALAGLKLDRGTPIALYNGSLVVRMGSFVPIAYGGIALPVLSSVLDLALPAGAAVTAYFYAEAGSPAAVFDSDREEVWGWGRECPATDFNDLTVNAAPSWWADSQRTALAALVHLRNCRDRQGLVEGLAALSGLTVTKSGPHYLELRPLGWNKARALGIIAEALGIRREEVIAVGDNDNDAEMLAWAGVGVSVAHSSAAAQSASDYVSRLEGASAILEILRLIKHARRYDSSRHGHAGGLGRPVP
jgi:hydroxymethylpyrimidine pyrophosphatase-like HAD family hydrolase